MGAVKLASLDGIRDELIGRTFPRSVLTRCETGLCLFAAGFLGRQDAVWMADAGLTVTCVDNDAKRIEEMQPLYPDGWEFVHADAWDYVESTGRMWDLVTADCPSNLFREAAAFVGEFCDVAREAVVVGSTSTIPVDPPDGWLVTQERKRSDYIPSGVYWTVLERE